MSEGNADERRLRRAAVTRHGLPAAGPSGASRPSGLTGPTGPQPSPVPVEATDEDDNAASHRMDQKALWADLQVRRAMARGDFDDLPGAGKPLQLPEVHDPDWWVKRLVEREKIAIAPPAIGLRREDAELDAALDLEFAEEGVRRAVEDFNRRVVEARRQLTGGPPVVTATRDADTEVGRWRERREEARQRAREAARRAREREQAAAEAARAERRQRWRRLLGGRDRGPA